MTDEELEVFAAFVRYLNRIGQIDALLRVGDPNVAAEKWSRCELTIGSDGVQGWFRHGRLHRDDGPALIDSDGREYWYSDGNHYTPTLTMKLTAQSSGETE